MSGCRGSWKSRLRNSQKSFPLNWFHFRIGKCLPRINAGKFEESWPASLGSLRERKGPLQLLSVLPQLRLESSPSGLDSQDKCAVSYGITAIRLKETMDKFIGGDHVRVNIQHRSSRSLDKGTMVVLQTKFSLHKRDGEALCMESGRVNRWIPFRVLKLVKREGTPDKVDGMEENRKLARLGFGNTLTKNIPYDPRAEFLTAAELRQGKGTPNTWHYLDLDRKQYNPDEVREIVEKNRALIDELTRSA
jgi:hypothetical protein